MPLFETFQCMPEGYNIEMNQMSNTLISFLEK